MYSDDETASEGDDEKADIQDIETQTLWELKTGRYKVSNSDGTLRCPTCSASKRKQSYEYADLLQHAKAVAVGKRGPEAAGFHSALVQFLENNLAHLAPVSVVNRSLSMPREAPQRREAEDLFVCPWSVIVCNIFQPQEKNSNQEGRIGYGKNDLKIHFADFSPDKIHVFWGPDGHLGVGLLQFGRELSGLNDALALERYFIGQDRGRKEYQRLAVKRDLQDGFFGWLAREEDVLFRDGEHGTKIAQYLDSHCDLKKIWAVGEEMTRIHEQRVRQLEEALAEKGDECMRLKTAIDVMQRTEEAEKMNLEETRQIGVESVAGIVAKSCDGEVSGFRVLRFANPTGVESVAGSWNRCHIL